MLSSSDAGIDDVDDLFTDLDGQEISVFGILTEPYEPVVFTSLMKPIVDEWAEVRLNDDSRQTFWTWRRSRTLPEFVPAAPAVRRAMVRGWFTGLVLGQINGHDAPGSGVTVWAPSRTGGLGRGGPSASALAGVQRTCRGPARRARVVARGTS